MFTVSGYALGKWQGSEINHDTSNNGLPAIRALFDKKDAKFKDLQNNSVSSSDHEAIVKQMQDRYENDIAAKDKIILDLQSQFQTAYEEAVAINGEVKSILSDYSE